MYDLDIQEVLDLLRTAYLDEDWTVINDAIDLIQKHLNEVEIEKIDSYIYYY